MISGRVQNEFGEPAAEATVTAWRIEYPQPGIRMWRQVKDATTNDLGEFRLHGLMPGRYHVVATRSAPLPELFVRTPDSGYVASMIGQSEGLPHISEAIAVETVRGGETSGATITLVHTRDARVSGSVIDSTGRPASSAFVTISPANSDGLPGRRGAQVNARTGLFTFSSVPVGEYRLTASAFRVTTGSATVPESASLAITVREDLNGLFSRRSSHRRRFELPQPGASSLMVRQAHRLVSR